MEKPLTDNEYTLERFQGKGGWTYAAIPEIPKRKDTPFGLMRVKGMIDDYAFTGRHLQPLGNGLLFLAINADIRKQIGKKEGDKVRITLFRDDAPPELPEDMELGLRDVPGAYDAFRALKEGMQKMWINHVAAAKRDETRMKRIAAAIGNVLSGNPKYP